MDDFVSALSHILNNQTAAKLNVVILGDINIDISLYTFATQVHLTIFSGRGLEQ